MADFLLYKMNETPVDGAVCLMASATAASAMRDR
jgi:hypothetical protein